MSSQKKMVKYIKLFTKLSYERSMGCRVRIELINKELIFIYLFIADFSPSSWYFFFFFVCCFFFHYVSAKFPLAFFRWFYRDLG